MADGDHGASLPTTVPFVLLEDRLTPGAPARLYSQPAEIVRCDTLEQVEAGFQRLEAGLARGLHAAGVFAYDLGFALEPRLRPHMPAVPTAPLIWMGLFPPPQALSPEAVDAVFAGLGPPPPIHQVRPAHTRELHVAKVRQVLARIAAGDIYQANLTFPIRFRYDGAPLRLYAALRTRQPVGHGGVAAFDDTWVLSVSPELFLRVADGVAQSRPMKGTAARAVDPVADADAARALHADAKQRAENLMIVDLIRNDLARVAEPGSVKTPDLFTVESYPGFHTLTSTVTARLRSGVGLRDRIGAVFPCGSVVGAPKIMAAEVLAELEGAPRGFYTGALGALGPHGEIDLNVAIRTAVIGPDGSGVYGVGGGVVADSDPDAEYDEAWLKAGVLEALAEDYALIETFRWSLEGGFVRLSRHLDRLAASAVALGFRFDRAAIAADLADPAETWAAAFGGDRRVRLLLARSGEASITHQPITSIGAQPLRIGVAQTRLDAGDPFLRHKTTRRTPYDAADAEAQVAGLDEMLLLNRSGDVADAARHTVFAQIDGRLLTPPLTAGALPGVLRAELIETGQAVEGRLTTEMLRQADALLLGNSLRGLRRSDALDKNKLRPIAPS